MVVAGGAQPALCKVKLRYHMAPTPPPPPPPPLQLFPPPLKATPPLPPPSRRLVQIVLRVARQLFHLGVRSRLAQFSYNWNRAETPGGTGLGELALCHWGFITSEMLWTFLFVFEIGTIITRFVFLRAMEEKYSHSDLYCYARISHIRLDFKFCQLSSLKLVCLLHFECLFGIVNN